MLDNISEVFESFGNVIDVLCVIVTHWDKMEAQGVAASTREATEILRVFSNYGIKKVTPTPTLLFIDISKVIFVGKDTDPEMLCNSLAKQCAASPVSVVIPKNEIYQKFDLAPPCLVLRAKVKKIRDEFDDLANTMRKV